MLLKRLINHYKKLNNYYNDLIIIKNILIKYNLNFIYNIFLLRINYYFINKNFIN